MKASAIRPAILVGMISLLLAGCAAHGSNGESGRRLIVFVDLSASIDREQRHRWGREAIRLIDSLVGGWAIGIYPIHDRTLDAAPLYQAEIPDWAPNATAEVARKQKSALLLVRKGAGAALEKAFSAAGGATQTDIFSAIDRIGPDPRDRRTVIIFFSDMLNSTPELNMERAGSLSRATIPSHIQNVARRHGWRPDLLSGAEVYCVLNAIESGRRAPAVDRLTQRDFYEALFGALGGRLALYDTNLSSLNFRKGGRHVAQAQ